MTHPTAYVLLPVHNRAPITHGFIETLAAQNYDRIHLVAIDDGSSDGTADMIQSLIPHSTVLKGEGKGWWGGSLQKGMQQLPRQRIEEEDAVIFINDDSRISPDFIAKGVAILARNPGSLVQATIRCVDTNEVVDKGYIFEDASLSFRPVCSEEMPNCLTTNGLFVRWSDLKRIGGFRPRVLPHYLSDYEFTFRAGKRGLKLLVAPELELSWQRKTTGYPQI